MALAREARMTKERPDLIYMINARNQKQIIKKPSYNQNLAVIQTHLFLKNVEF